MGRQPPPRGCVLKLVAVVHLFYLILQPPPRGCVLKQLTLNMYLVLAQAAASARLCVETSNANKALPTAKQPPPRGCVLKPPIKNRP